MLESTEIQLARLDERMKMLLDRMEENQEAHSASRIWMQKMDTTLLTIDSRVSNVEDTLAKSAPSIEEFMQIKNRVIGAGLAGRWIWITLGALLGIVMSMRETIVRFFAAGG